MSEPKSDLLLLRSGAWRAEDTGERDTRGDGEVLVSERQDLPQSGNESQFVGFFGRPPLAPLRRAAAAFARDVRPLLASPPSRPSATAAGFLRGMALVPAVDWPRP